MALSCPDARPCCAAVYVAFVPQAVGSLAPQQMLWASHTPMVLSPGGLPDWQSATVDETLGLGAPLRNEVMTLPQQQGAHQAVQQTPAQCFMGCPENLGASNVWSAPSQFVMGMTECAPGDMQCGMGWFSQSSVPSMTQVGAAGAQQTEDEAFAPDQVQMNTDAQPQDSGCTISELGSCVAKGAVVGMTSSMLRRRRRQRAAMRSPVAGADEPSVGALALDEEGAAGEDNVSGVADALLKQLQESAGSRHGAARFRRLAFADKASSRAAQMALEEARGPEAAALAAGMHGFVRPAMRSMYANYVIQKIVEVMPWSSASFIPQELLGAAREVARHRFGCRIMCRLLEHGPLQDRSLAALLEEVLGDTTALSCHAFGNYVVRHSLEFGLPEHRRWVALALCGDLYTIAGDQYGSRVVETALQFSGPDEQQMLAAELVRDPQLLVALAMNVAGRHVVKALLQMHGEYTQQAAAFFRSSAKELRESRYGKLVLDAAVAI
eukprot:TRINITY_DN1583_c0_g1_i2.p1 TRINITY_DN1583_c0_g1~~TRINITY_DN1583_c0_g1_i2.p1  ORF type:complete len:495 (-),score=99.27 TRINITY_DN1583_c0_g1_i2:438-1922(-)